MRSIFLHIILLSFLSSYAQEKIDTTNRCFIENEEVVYEFDSRKPAKPSNPIIYDFDDLEVYQAIENGEIDQWERNGWIMRQIDAFTYQIRKKINEFTGHIDPWEKFNLTQNYWIGPNSELHGENSIYYAPEDLIKPGGNTKFYLDGFHNHEEVILSGSFNDWHEQMLKMNRTEQGWELNLQLEPGIYEYKFILDGTWMEDPANELTIENQHQTLNSILLIGELFSFKLYGFKNAQRVFLAGSFNNWQEESIELKWDGTAWTTEIKIPPGKHYYKFIVDGDWMTDPGNELHEQDGEGNLNSVLIFN